MKKKFIILLNQRFSHSQNSIILKKWLKSDDKYVILMTDFANTDPDIIKVIEINEE